SFIAKMARRFSPMVFFDHILNLVLAHADDRALDPFFGASASKLHRYLFMDLYVFISKKASEYFFRCMSFFYYFRYLWEYLDSRFHLRHVILIGPSNNLD